MDELDHLHLTPSGTLLPPADPAEHEAALIALAAAIEEESS